jgi:hypothetical protein
MAGGAIPQGSGADLSADILMSIHRQWMALQAKHRLPHPDHLGHGRAVRVVTNAAILNNRLMLPREGTLLGLVTLETGLVLGQQLPRHIAVRIMAADTAHRSLPDRVMVRHRNPAEYLLMAAQAESRRGIGMLHLKCPVGLQAKPIGAVRIVTVDALYPRSLVTRKLPIKERPAAGALRAAGFGVRVVAMTRQTIGIVRHHYRSRFAAGICMNASRPMALFARAADIAPHVPVPCELVLLHKVLMAFTAGIQAYILGPWSACRSFARYSIAAAGNHHKSQGPNEK